MNMMKQSKQSHTSSKDGFEQSGQEMAGKNDEQQWSHDQSFPEGPIKTIHQIRNSKKQTIHCQ